MHDTSKSQKVICRVKIFYYLCRRNLCRMERINKICICGGGSLGLVCAGMLSARHLDVSILTGHPNKWQRDIKVIDPNGVVIEGALSSISSCPADVIPDADLVFLTVPGFLIEKTLREIHPYLKPDAIVGSVVSSTGFFFAAHAILADTQCIFGFQRVPYIARKKEYGTVGLLLGYKPELNVAIENCDDPAALVSQLQTLFDTPIRLLSNIYEASLTNSNPILHTGRLYAMWKDYDGGVIPNPEAFYADWDDDSSRYIIAMDEEFQELMRRLGIREGVIPTLLDYYESTDAPSLTRKIRSIKAFTSIGSPVVKTPAGWIPDFESRYFAEDFPYGLRFIKELAEKNGVSTPVIDTVYAWGMKMASNH